MAGVAPLDEAELKSFILEFYAKADAGAPLVWFLPYIDEKFHMIWTPTCQFSGPAGFEEFYRNLTQRSFDRQHDVSNIQVETNGDTAKVTFVINLTQRVWYPPAPKSLLAKNEARFLWTVKRSPETGKPAIMDYFLTGVKFPEGSIIVNADQVFKYEQPLWGPFAFPPE